MECKICEDWPPGHAYIAGNLQHNKNYIHTHTHTLADKAIYKIDTFHIQTKNKDIKNVNRAF